MVMCDMEKLPSWHVSYDLWHSLRHNHTFQPGLAAAQLTLSLTHSFLPLAENKSMMIMMI